MATYADDIKRIAKGDKLKEALGAWSERDPIKGTTTPYIEGAFSVSNSGGGSGTNNSTSGSTNTNGSTEQDGTQPTDPNDPFTFNKGGGSSTTTETQESTGSQDVESVIDNDVQQPAPDGSYADTGDYSGSGSLTSLTGATDCTTGQCINFRLDGNFIPPDGWDDPDTPPPDETWEYGYYFQSPADTAGAGGIFPTKSQADAFVESKVFAKMAEFSWTVISSSWSRGWPEAHVDTFIVTGDPTGLSSIHSKISCTPSESDPLCPLTAPQATEWPSDDCYDLSLIDGTFQTNPYDSEAPANAGGSVVDFCFGTGRTGRVYATAQGGTMIVETTVTDPVTTYTAKVYNADGTFSAAGDATTQFMNQYLPQ